MVNETSDDEADEENDEGNEADERNAGKCPYKRSEHRRRSRRRRDCSSKHDCLYLGNDIEKPKTDADRQGAAVGYPMLCKTPECGSKEFQCSKCEQSIRCSSGQCKCDYG